MYTDVMTIREVAEYLKLPLQMLSSMKKPATEM